MIGGAYAAGRERICEIVAALDQMDVVRPVPACPGWSVRDVVAHLSGVCADILAGNLAGVATDPWTEAQVGERRGRSLHELLAEWQELAPQVEAFAGGFPGRTGAQWVLDLTTHEHDIRAALDRPGARDSDGVSIGLDFLVTVGLHSSVSARGLAPLAVRSTDGPTWTVGTGMAVGGGDGRSVAEATSELAAAALVSGHSPPAGEPAGSVEAPTFELFRALTGRRSLDQIRRFCWDADPESYLPAFEWGPFRPSRADLNG
ncbi:MAG: maleylpyruvate isomerase family mycothiol-dependent enzyme [Acidimicrobiales bacterium]